MKLTLHTEFTFDSAHRLDGYDGKCSKFHGHTWKVECWFKGSSSRCNKVGILVDFGIVKDLREYLDHKLLNDVMCLNPTAENLVAWLGEHLRIKISKQIGIKVRVYETAVDKQTWCEGDWI